MEVSALIISLWVDEMLKRVAHGVPLAAPSILSAFQTLEGLSRVTAELGR